MADETIDPEPEKRFDPESLDWKIVAQPLLEIIAKLEKKLEAGQGIKPIPVIIDLNFKFEGGLVAAKAKAIELVKETVNAGNFPKRSRLDQSKMDLSPQYLIGSLEPDLIRGIARRSLEGQRGEGETLSPFIRRPIFMIWPDFEVNALTMKSISTVKADAAHRAFSAGGDDIVWAVLDSGVDGSHQHFQGHKNLRLEDLDPPLRHWNFTGEGEDDPLNDKLGHGTHVAGIISGEAMSPGEKYQAGGLTESGLTVSKKQLKGRGRWRDERGEKNEKEFEIPHVSGMAPRAKLVSFKILNDNGKGSVSNILAAIAKIQEINEHGRWLKIHGVNLSVGYDFEPEWFACGQSPLCVEVDRLVKSGVVVVAAAGNTGYGLKQTTFRGSVASGMLMSVNDPGNADLAITVGSTHREMPHVYGVSYFSSKGPTGDGRLKPDLVAPGERIISCAAGKHLGQCERGDEKFQYGEHSGTSMAAPHVSGAIAAFLSIRREFIGQPEKVKEIFLENATDLKRERYMQGQGLVDLMRSIQAV